MKKANEKPGNYGKEMKNLKDILIDKQYVLKVDIGINEYEPEYKEFIVSKDEIISLIISMLYVTDIPMTHWIAGGRNNKKFIIGDRDTLTKVANNIIPNINKEYREIKKHFKLLSKNIDILVKKLDEK